MQARSQKLFIISYMYLAVELIIFLSFIDTQYKNILFVPNELNLQLKSTNSFKKISRIFSNLFCYCNVKSSDIRPKLKAKYRSNKF